MLGDKIRKTRKAKGLTVSALADLAGVSESYVSQLERGLVDPSVSLLRKLAASLQVPVASFFDEDGEPPIITRFEDREQIISEDGTISFSWISPDAENLHLEMVEITIHPEIPLSAPKNLHYTSLVLTEGCVSITYADTTEELYRGDSIFIPQDTAYTITALGSRTARGLLCVSKGGC